MKKMGNKLNNLKLGLAGLLLAGGLNGCGEYLSKLHHVHVLKKYTPLTKQEKDSLFNNLNYGLREFIDKVYIINNGKDLTKERTNHVHGNRIMCLTNVDKLLSTDGWIIIPHESAHVRHLALDLLKFDFSKEWEQIANFKYGKKNFKEVDWFGQPLGDFWDDKNLDFYEDGPKQGILSPRASINIQEDVATFIECLGYLQNKDSIEKMKLYQSSSCCLTHADTTHYLYSVQKTHPLFFADTTDHRYQKKLDLLEEYNFLTKEEHEKLSKNLGSLNYLLKK